ncbi:MAG: hypothetical protein WC283_01060, partial [Candidatus Paceibacterota bacterium]
GLENNIGEKINLSLDRSIDSQLEGKMPSLSVYCFGEKHDQEEINNSIARQEILKMLKIIEVDKEEDIEKKMAVISLISDLEYSSYKEQIRIFINDFRK